MLANAKSRPGRKDRRPRGGASLLVLAAALALAPLSACSLMDDNVVHRGYVFDEQNLSQVRVGSAAEQVLIVLGTPSTTSTVGGDAWYYIGQKMHRSLAFMPVEMTDQQVVAVYFDKNSKVTRIANYGMKDGQVFDFVSRTTPTGGQEPDFIRNIMSGLFRFT